MTDGSSLKFSFPAIFAFVWKYMTLYRGRLYLAMGLSIIATSFDLIPRVLYGKMVDSLTTNNFSQIESTVLFFFALFILSKIIRYIIHFLSIATYNIQAKCMATLYKDSFVKVQSMSSEWFASTFTGSIVRKINRGVYALERFADICFFNFYPSTVILIGVIVLTARESLLLAGITALGSIIYVASSVFLAFKFITPRQRKNLAEDTKTAGIVADSITGNPTVKSFGAESKENAILMSQIGIWEKTKVAAWFSFITTSLVQNILLVILEGALFIVALLLWKKGDISIGDLVLILSFMQLIWGYLQDMGNRIREFLETATDLQETMELHFLAPQVQDKKNAPELIVQKGNIEFKEVDFSYEKGNSNVFSGLQIRIPSQQKVALVGYSGSGKSTFVKLLQRLYDIQKGSICIDGINIAEVSQESLRKHIALVPQDPILFHRSLFDNIAYGNESASKEEVIEAAKMAHAHEFIKDLPLGYNTLVGERGIKLSGGERQRVAIARAILADTPIIILDEATSSLDSESERYIQDALHTLLQGKTAIIVAHRLSTIKEVDRILVFNKGEIIEDGSFEELLQKKGVFAKLWSLQRLE